MATSLFLSKGRPLQGMWLSWANLTLGVLEIFSYPEIMIAFWSPFCLNMPSCLIMRLCFFAHLMDRPREKDFCSSLFTLKERTGKSKCLLFIYLFIYLWWFSSSSQKICLLFLTWVALIPGSIRVFLWNSCLQREY